jgi:hypothetical protein
MVSVGMDSIYVRNNNRCTMKLKCRLGRHNWKNVGLSISSIDIPDPVYYRYPKIWLFRICKDCGKTTDKLIWEPDNVRVEKEMVDKIYKTLMMEWSTNEFNV